MRVFVLGIAGSIRSCPKRIDSLVSSIHASSSHKDLADRILQLSATFSNTDIALAFALFTAKQRGAQIDIISLRSIFKQSSRSNTDFNHLQLDDFQVARLINTVKKADGVIFSTPTYFGDRSSVANKFFQLADSYDLLKNKVFGVVSVGAKRNGGQETTCIYCIVDALAQSAIAVGNGPITSQYGGTVVAGDIMSALDDDWGLERCKELGSKVAYTSGLISLGLHARTDIHLDICVLMTMDTPDKRYSKVVNEYFSSLNNCHTVEIIDLIDYPIQRCLACDVCPKLGEPGEANEYRCIIQNPDDCVVAIFPKMIKADLIIVAGINSTNELIYRYQSFIERTRCIRRNNYQLSNTPVSSLLVNDLRAHKNLLHTSKVITSYIRHNTIILSPISITLLENTVVHQTDFSTILNQAQIVKIGRKMSIPCSTNYVADGYKNA